LAWRLEGVRQGRDPKRPEPGDAARGQRSPSLRRL